MAAGKPIRTLADIVGSLISEETLTDEALLATEREIGIICVRTDLTDEEKDILHAVLESIQNERTQRQP